MGGYSLLALVSLPVGATVTWNITFEDVADGTNVGFDDPAFGAARRSTVQSVFDYLDTVIGDSGSADITINSSQTDGSGFLASAGPFFFTGPDGFSNGLLFEHASTGTDPSGSVVDATATFDFGYNWNSETDSPTGTEFDLFSVTLHEFSHAMGFLSLAGANGRSDISGGDPGVFSVYDSFLERGDGSALFGAGGAYLGNPPDLRSDDVFFGGPNATAANGGNPVQVHAPGTFSDGSSISHLDDSLSGVMNYSIGPGEEMRSYAAFELGILQDIGWNIVIPELSGTLLLIPILGGACCLHRRRRRCRAMWSRTALVRCPKKID